MTEAVIVATSRSPIGRAAKGSLVSIRPDDLSAQIVRALMAKVPQVGASDVEDLIMGCGQPAGEAGFNVARVTAVLAGLDNCPGVTVNRYCSSSLQTIRMAAHAIKAGEGDCFIAAGVETVSRYASGASDTAPNQIFSEPGSRTAGRAGGGQGTWLYGWQSDCSQVSQNREDCCIRCCDYNLDSILIKSIICSTTRCV